MTIMPWTGPGQNLEQPWGTPQGLLGPRRRGGLFGASANIPQQPAMTATPQPMAPKQSFFGEGGVGRAIAGNIGDFLLQYSGMQPIYAPIMQQRQAAQAAERERQQGLADWVAKQEYEAAHRPPTYFDDNAGNRWAIGADGQPKLAFRDPTQKYVQQVVTDPDGSQRLIQVPVPNNVRPDGTFDNAVVGGGGRPAIGAVVADPRKAGGQPVAPAGNFR